MCTDKTEASGGKKGSKQIGLKIRRMHLMDVWKEHSEFLFSGTDITRDSKHITKHAYKSQRASATQAVADSLDGMTKLWGPGSSIAKDALENAFLKQGIRQ